MSRPTWALPHSSWKNAVPTNLGWVNSETGEKYSGHRGLLDKMTAAGWTDAPKPTKASKPTPTAKSNPALNELSKDQLESLGREKGVELDKRKSKKDLIKELKSI
tara:strand:- start:1206 stop:1520 length:315 start_codon:yes stop_codon:yes gene_type:complete